MNLPHVPGPHGGTQTVAHAVAPSNSLILCVKGADAGDRAEDLLLHDAGAVRYTRDDGGWHKVAVAVALREVQLVNPFTAVDDATFRLGESYKASNLGIKKKDVFKVIKTSFQREIVGSFSQNLTFCFITFSRCSLLISAPLLLLGSEGTPVFHFFVAATNLSRNAA